MRQVLQYLGHGELCLVDVPLPGVQKGHLLIRNQASIISPGTEKMLIEFSKAGWIDRARQQPEKVKQVIQKLKTDGFLSTIHVVRTKLDQPISLGYSSAGEVIDVGENVSGFRIGDRVISNGPHAEVVSVPQNLCAMIPNDVDYNSAAFTVLGSIALQGVRLAQPTLGETFVVMGLGLVGLLTVQLLLINGCRVIGIDPNRDRTSMARSLGAKVVDVGNDEDLVPFADSLTRGKGVDGVILAATTDSNKPVHQAAQMCRKRARITLVGTTGLKLSRADFYEKELIFQVSCSYGPGRYDANYELKGNDYPYGFVRWTEQRNFEAILDLMSQGQLNVEDLITHHLKFDNVLEAYDILMTNQSAVGIVLSYAVDESTQQESERTVLISSTEGEPAKTNVVIGIIGSGNHSAGALLPALKKTGAHLKTITSLGGLSSTHLAKKFGFEKSTTDIEEILSDDEINAVVIVTRHDTHASYVRKSLEHGKAVFVEKPLALSNQELAEIESIIDEVNNPFLMVGFNRRFAPQVKKMKKLLSSISEPKSFIMTVNAGSMPEDHWTQDPEVGGGRIIGEACHFIDLLRYLTGATIVEIQATKIGSSGGIIIQEDKMTFTMKFKDGSFGTVHYLANGHRAFPKERLEVFCGGRMLLLNNFKKLRGFGWPDFSKMNLWYQDKGHRACLVAFTEAVAKRKLSPTPFDEIIEATRASFEILELSK